VTVDFERFAAMFRASLQDVLVAAQTDLRVSEQDVVKLHVQGEHETSISNAAERMYVSSTSFYKYIDMSALQRLNGVNRLFVRVSGHPVVGWDETHDPSHRGPFKVLVPN